MVLFDFPSFATEILIFGYLAPLTNLAAQTEFSQRGKDCIAPEPAIAKSSII